MKSRIERQAGTEADKYLQPKLPTSASVAANPMLSAASLKDGVGAYCKGGCGGIIYAVTNDRMKDKSAKQNLDWYWENGYLLGRISKEDVSKHWGCFCQGSR